MVLATTVALWAVLYAASCAMALGAYAAADGATLGLMLEPVARRGGMLRRLTPAWGAQALCCAGSAARGLLRTCTLFTFRPEKAPSSGHRADRAHASDFFSPCCAVMTSINCPDSLARRKPFLPWLVPLTPFPLLCGAHSVAGALLGACRAARAGRAAAAGGLPPGRRGHVLCAAANGLPRGAAQGGRAVPEYWRRLRPWGGEKG